MLLILSMGIISSVAYAADTDNKAIAERIKPVGSVYLAGAAPKAQAAAKPAGPRSGQQVYQSACFACHGTGALNSPKAHTEQWQPRLAKGMDTLMKHAIEGFNAMPPKGTCMDCSDDEIKAAIEFMASK